MRKTSKRGPYRKLDGQVFDRLTVLGPAGTRDKQGYYEWLCQCACGTRITVSWKKLARRQRKSCGCWYRDRMKLPDGEAGLHRLIQGYKSKAKSRGYEWSLSKEEFRQLTSSDCFYCGTPPGKRLSSWTMKSPSKSKRTDYIYNGVDRVDNSKGYTADNCLPCCHDCNWGKVDKSVDDFYTWIERIYCYGRGIKQ